MGQLPNQTARGAEGGEPDLALTKRRRELDCLRHARYRITAKGRAAQARYDHSEAGKMMRRLFNQTPARRLSKILAQQMRRRNGR